MAQQLNLFDHSLRPQRQWLTPARLVALLLLLVAAMVLLAQLWRREAVQLQARTAAAQAELQALAAAAPRAAAEDPELPRLRSQLAQARALSAALTAHPEAVPEQAAQVLAALSAAATPGVWISAVQWQAQPRQLALEGGLLQAPQLPPYLRRLEAQSAFHGQSFAQLQLAPPPLAPGQRASEAVLTHHVFALRSQAREAGR